MSVQCSSAPGSAAAEGGSRYDDLTARACRFAAEAYTQPVPENRILVTDPFTDAQAVVEILEDGHAVVAFRGSSSHMDWVHNAMVPLKPLPSPHRSSVRAHGGFLRQYTSIQAQMHKILRDNGTTHVLLCGHSLGGALAVIAAAMMPESMTCDVVTFGAPRAGNAELSKAAFGRCVKCVRVVHDRDVVPTVPFRLLGYSHICEPWVHLDENGYVRPVETERGWFEQLRLRALGLFSLDFGIRDHLMRAYLGDDWPESKPSETAE